MEENKRKFDWKAIVIIILAVIAIVCFAKINGLNNSISSLQGNISILQHQISSMNGNINSIYNNVDEMLKKEASILSDVDYSLGELDTSTHTVPVTVKMVPKTLTDNMMLSLNVGEETIGFERNGSEFSATFPANIFIAHRDFPMLSITANGETKTEVLESLPLTALYTRYLPTIYSYVTPFDEFKNGKLEIDGSLIFDVKPASSESNVSIMNVELVTEKNGKEIARTDVTSKVLSSNGMDRIQPDHSVIAAYDAKYGDEICIFVVAKDSLGYTHKIPAYYWCEIDENTSQAFTVVDNSNEIYDINGNLLTKPY